MFLLEDKVVIRGVETLTDAEILTLILGSESQAAELLQAHQGSLAAITEADLQRLRMVAGIGLKNAMLLKVCAEWGRRCAVATTSEQVVISTSTEVVDLFRPYFLRLKYEECWVLFLSASNRVVERYRVSKGGVTATVVDHRLIIKRALELLSTQFIMVHNHPSGAVNPSREDIELTEKVKQAAELFDIALVDHIIISPSAYFSFLSHKIL